jgi:hypothetical protein
VRAPRRIDGVHDCYAVGGRSELALVGSSDPSAKRLELSHKGVAKLVSRRSEEAQGGACETALVSAGEEPPVCSPHLDDFGLRTVGRAGERRSRAAEF